MCNANACVKQRNSCLFFCPEGFTCQYGMCVADALVPAFLQELTPYLYTSNARVQPSDPNTPLYNTGMEEGNDNSGSAAMVTTSAATALVVTAAFTAVINKLI